jgi:hypothetical protein
MHEKESKATAMINKLRRKRSIGCLKESNVRKTDKSRKKVEARHRKAREIRPEQRRLEPAKKRNAKFVKLARRSNTGR